jgi:hypothetical protein
MVIEGNLFVRNEAYGEDPPGDAGTGGAVSMRGWPSFIRNNTFVDNTGTGAGPCTGGHILVSDEKSVEITSNVFVGAEGCAISCSNPSFATVAHGNLFWDNAPSDIGDPKSCFPDLGGEDDVFADPLFCDPAADDYRVRSDSPAITGGNPIGAYPTPGCSAP